jgi:hypothetical protein
MISSADEAVLLFRKWESEKTVLRFMMTSSCGRAVVTCPGQIESVSPISVAFAWRDSTTGVAASEGKVSLKDATFGFNTPSDLAPPLKELAESSVDNFLVVGWPDGPSIGFIEHKE